MPLLQWERPLDWALEVAAISAFFLAVHRRSFRPTHKTEPKIALQWNLDVTGFSTANFAFVVSFSASNERKLQREKRKKSGENPNESGPVPCVSLILVNLKFCNANLRPGGLSEPAVYLYRRALQTLAHRRHALPAGKLFLLERCTAWQSG